MTKATVADAVDNTYKALNKSIEALKDMKVFCLGGGVACVYARMVKGASEGLCV